MSNTHCPDCGREYREVAEVVGPPAEVVIETVSAEDMKAEAHREFECPAQRTRDHQAALEAAVRWFGIADTLKQLHELFMRDDNEFDVEVIRGNARRWYDKTPERWFHCPHCLKIIGITDGKRLKMPGVEIEPPDDESGLIGCGACEQTFPLREALAAAVRDEGHDETWSEVM
jgi:hypothetical protein